MSLDVERAEILKAKTMANKIVKDADERRRWIIDQADVYANEEVRKHTDKLKAEYGSKVYDISPFEKDLQEHRKTDIEVVQADYAKNESAVVDFLIGHITNVKIELPRNILAEYKEKKEQEKKDAEKKNKQKK